MTRRLISSGSVFEERIGYSRAVVDGSYLFVSGTTGYDYPTLQISDDVVAQAEQCFVNLANVLAEAGCTFADVVHVRYIFPERANFEACWPVLKKRLGSVKPAATMIMAGLYDPAMKLEIEVIAKRP
jgi:enamine deaminase RidA (YjgF/YER057c/UK114 family)